MIRSQTCQSRTPPTVDRSSSLRSAKIYYPMRSSFFSAAFCICICFVTVGCASNHKSIRADSFSPSNSLFKNLILSQQEKQQIVDQLKISNPLPKYIFKVYREAPDKIQVLTMDESSMRFPTGRLYHLKKTKPGWIINPNKPVDSWGML